MPESVPSDAVDSVRATLERAGRTDRPKIVFPEEDRDAVPEGELVRIGVDGETYHARIERAIDDSLELRGLYENARLAREADGENHLDKWADDHGLDFGRTVHVDVVDAGFFYGLRAPGERAVYRVPERPDEGLADIAADLEEAEEP
ncbi:hypothetical protein [Halosegnis sp.]|uniref:DUF7112 family protein n=1 Tax=Halosegnis sp. TaxID=2864959 RepID=UPI0035D4E6EF